MATNYLDIGVVQQGTLDIGPMQHQFVITSTQTILAKARVQETTSQTIAAQARLAGLVQQTIQGKARILETTTQTITSKGRVRETSTQTLTAKGRVGQVSTPTITSLARVQELINATIAGKARILETTNQTITSKASVREITAQTITSKARLALTSTQTLTSLARIKKTSTSTIPAKANLVSLTSHTLDAKAAIQGTTVRTIGALGKIIPLTSVCVDFEGFPIGYFPAGGVWGPPLDSRYTSRGATLPVVTSGGPDNSTRYLSMINGDFEFTPGFYIPEASLVFNYQVNQGNGFPDSAPFVIFEDFSGSTSHHIPEVHITGDGALAFFLPDGTYPGFSKTFSMHQNRIYWFQINVKHRVIGGFLHIEASIFADGEVIVPQFVAGPILTSTFGFGFDRITISPPGAGVGVGLDNYCIKPYTNTVFYPAPGNPKARVAQAFIEVPELPDSSNVRVGQGYIDLIELPTTARVRVANGFIELLTKSDIIPPIKPIIPTPFLGRANCTVQVRPIALPTVPDPPIMGIPNPSQPPNPPGRTCHA